MTDWKDLAVRAIINEKVDDAAVFSKFLDDLYDSLNQVKDDNYRKLVEFKITQADKSLKKIISEIDSYKSRRFEKVKEKYAA